MNNSTPQKRKSLPIEKKLEIYEFEVDENEPKIKQKKKRAPKPGVKHKVNWGYNVGGINIKSPVKHEIVKKKVKAKNRTISSVKNEVPNKVLSTKNSSSPLFENKRRPVKEVFKVGLSSSKQKENIANHLTVDLAVINESHRTFSSENSHILGEKSDVKCDGVNVMCGTFSELQQKENLGQQILKDISGKDINRKTLSSKRHSRRKTVSSNQNEVISLPPVKENPVHPTLEVPVLFHNHQHDSPFKNKISLRAKKPSFSAMSDDENNINESYGDKATLDHLFCPISRFVGNSETPSKSSLNHNSIYDYKINASTPVKYNNSFNNTCNSTVENYFGFDELESFEEPFVSPIKNPEEISSSHSCRSEITSNKLSPKQGINHEIPVSNIIRMLKYGDEAENIGTRSKSSSSNSPSPIFNDDNILLQEVEPVKQKIVKPVPRRSYERPAYLRKKNQIDEEENSDEENHEETVKSITKKKHGQSKKEQEEMHKWIKQFNSQCQEIEKFDLLVE